MAPLAGIAANDEKNVLQRYLPDLAAVFDPDRLVGSHR